MFLQDMYQAVQRRVDDIPSLTDVTEWLNAGKNDLCVILNASFPDLDINNPTTSTYVFDPIYHELPVLYACARYKEQDTALQEAQNFMAQYEAKKQWMSLNYVVPPQYRNDDTTQQFTTTSGQTTFTITKDTYDDTVSDPVVYVNGLLLSNKYALNYTVNQDGTNSITLANPCNTGDLVSIVWEQHNDWVDTVSYQRW